MHEGFCAGDFFFRYALDGPSNRLTAGIVVVQNDNGMSQAVWSFELSDFPFVAADERAQDTTSAVFETKKTGGAGVRILVKSDPDANLAVRHHLCQSRVLFCESSNCMSEIYVVRLSLADNDRRLRSIEVTIHQELTIQ